jgi:sirohydrochlorin ferrochelatase
VHLRAILLVDHGSRRPEPNQMLACVAAMVREQVGVDVIVRHAHMELAAPDIAAGFASCVTAGATEVIVHPYFLGPGRHATEDIPRLVEEAARRHLGVTFRVTEPLGLDPRIGEAILARCGITTSDTTVGPSCAGDPSGCALRFCK